MKAKKWHLAKAGVISMAAWRNGVMKCENIKKQ